MKNIPTRAILPLLLTAGMLVAAGCDKHTSTGETVGQRVDKAIDRTNEKVIAASDKVGATVDRAGASVAQVAGAISDKADETTAAVNDGAITASIKADFVKDPDLDVLKIDVDTRNGLVSLNGLTYSEAARERAARIAAATKGVTGVNNHLVVKKH